MTKRNLIFLSYASEDVAHVQKIYQGLKKRGLDVWFDKQDLIKGRWLPAVERAITRSRFFVFCLSKASLRKLDLDRPGFVDHELQTAWKIAESQPESDFTIIPVRIDDCDDRGDHRLSPWQQHDLNDPERFESTLTKLADALNVDQPMTEDKRLIESLLGKSSIAYSSGDYALALQLTNVLIEMDPRNLGAWYNKGLTLLRKGETQKALNAFDFVTEIAPTNVNAWVNKVSLLSSSGQTDKASKALSELAEIYRNELHQAEGAYAAEVEKWTSAAQFDASFGRLTPSMSDYYDNEVRVAHRYYSSDEYQSLLKAKREEIRSLQSKVRDIEELERIDKMPNKANSADAKNRAAD